MRAEDLQHLRCPGCHQALSWSGRERRGLVHRGRLACGRCGSEWPVRDGFPRLVRESDVRGSDRLLRHFYDNLPYLHDPAVRLVMPLQGSSEATIRARWMPRLELEALGPPEGGGPVRILEVGIGTGPNVPLLRERLRAGLDVELWGLDLAAGMLTRCRRRLRRSGAFPLRLMVGDAHALPFPRGFFERVFHVGAMGSFNDPRKALAEMARVAKPGTPIVVVDEQLDPSERHSLATRLLFRLITFYDADPHSPTELLPPGATEVLSEQVSRFYYCLRFRCP